MKLFTFLLLLISHAAFSAPPAGLKEIVAAGQTFYVESNPQTVLVDLPWSYGGDLKKMDSYRAVAPETMKTYYGNVLVKTFLTHPGVNIASLYTLAEDTSLKITNKSGMESTLTLAANMPVGFGYAIVWGATAKTYFAPLQTGAAIPIAGNKVSAGVDGAFGALASDYDFVSDKSRLILEAGRVVSVNNDFLEYSYVKSGQWFFIDGSWMKIYGTVRLNRDRELIKFNILGGSLFGKDNILRQWKSVNDFTYVDGNVQVLGGDLETAETVHLPELSINALVTNIEFFDTASPSKIIKKVRLAQPIYSSLCVDYSKPSTVPNKSCYDFTFYSYIDYDTYAGFSSIVKYNKKILWDITTNGTGIPWKNQSDAKVAEKLGYCAVHVVRWGADILHSFEQANIRGYIRGYAANSCSTRPEMLE